MTGPYIDADPADPERPTALLVHGIAGDVSGFRHMRADLRDRGYRTIAVELTGHGRAPRRATYHFADWTEELLHIVDSLDDTPDLIVGHSMGGLLAAGIAPIAQPRRLLLIDPLFTTMPDYRKRVGTTLVKFNADHPELLTRLFRRTWTAEDLAASRTSRERWDPATLHGLQNDPGTRILNRFYASAVPARTWLVRPRRSFLVPAALIPALTAAGVHLIEHRTASHFPHIDHPADFTALLDTVLA